MSPIERSMIEIEDAIGCLGELNDDGLLNESAEPAMRKALDILQGAIKQARSAQENGDEYVG